MRSTGFRLLFALLAVMAVLACATDADARVGGGFSSGSRGLRTFAPPAATPTAPNSAAPIQRSITRPGQPAASPIPRSGFFNRPGLLGGLFAGFLGAGLFGLLFGQGLFGGLGGFASLFGLLIQLLLVAVAARLIWTWWQRRSAPAYAGGSMLRGIAPLGGGGPGVGGQETRAEGIRIGQADFDSFERVLSEIQLAYGAEDVEALRARVTPEMLSYFSEDLAKNASRGVVNRISDVKLLQGDLAEAWREGPIEYATVAMRFSVIDRMIDRASGRVVEGDASRPVEATELWTFTRSSPAGSWLLSAIQQA